MLPARGSAAHPAGHSLSQWPDSTRDHLPNPSERGGARLRAIATLGEQSHRTAKAIAWIRANYAQPLRVDDLAKIAGMGVSTLHHHFQALTAMSPLQYQKQLRLQAARGRMLMDDLDAASVVFEVGYKMRVSSIASRRRVAIHRPVTGASRASPGRTHCELTTFQRGRHIPSHRARPCRRG